MKTEYREFIETLRRLGIEFSFNYGPTKKNWQNIITRQGFNLTALACHVIIVGDSEHLFSTGQACWTNNDKGYGPEGVHILSRSKKTRKVTPRRYHDHVTGVATGIRGLEALKAQYPHHEWP
jgi:hypothetical protein